MKLPLQSAYINQITRLPLNPMHKSDGRGVDIFVDNSGDKPFGMSVVEFQAEEGVKTHTHIGSHILMVMSGKGELGYYEETHKLETGLFYNIPHNVPHSIKATSKLVMLVIGNDYRSVSSPERLSGGGSLKDTENV